MDFTSKDILGGGTDDKQGSYFESQTEIRLKNSLRAADGAEEKDEQKEAAENIVKKAQ